jgi:arabinofuranan 3-O-arabinosyltransferase
VLGLLAFMPLVLSHPGMLPADTKLGLTLDPGRLMATSARSWDVSQFAGWVPHQAISFLWPSGPFYASLTWFGVPAWLVQRVFVGSVLFVGGLGVWWFVRRRGYGVSAAFTAALIYQTSPYVLPYVSRTSLMLLPWAGVGWLMGLAELAATRTGRAWVRPTALFALVVGTVGGINLTATLMIAPAPVLHLLQLARQRETTWRRATGAALRLGAASCTVSLWWMAMLATQSRYGAKVLGYSETLEAVSSTATSPEVLRGMGYWLAYVHAPSGTTTTAAGPYMTSPWLIAVGFALLVLCLAALVAVRFAERALAGWLLLTGVVLAVGAHPITSASPLFSGIASASRSTLALALRSSTRAAPLVVMATALAAAALVETAARGSARWRRCVLPVFVVLAIANQPAIFTGAMVDPALLHDQRPPAEWYSTAATLDRSEQRVLQLPGVESQVFTWGYTVDPPLPSLTDRQVVTRDWLPLGSPAVMDLLYAFDDRLQDGTIDPRAVPVVARFLGVDTVWLALDADSQRFGSAAATDVAAVLAEAPDVAIGAADGTHVRLYDIAAPVSITRAARRTVVLYGSGDGLVDAAAAGLLRGDEAVLYAADLSEQEQTELIAAGADILLTDSNRDRAHQWRGSQDVWGFTEAGGPSVDVLRFDPQDARLPVFTEERAAEQTIARSDGLTVQATSYGSPIGYRPEHRPALAVDGDPATSWLVGIDNGPTVGEQIVLSGTDGALRLVQPTGAASITRVAVTTTEGTSSVALADPGGQSIVVGEGAVTITIEAVSGVGPVGFSELLATAHPETVRVPELTIDPGPAPFAVVLTRLRSADIDRPDQEPTLRRQFSTPALATPGWAVAVTASATVSAGCRDDLVRLDDIAIPLAISEADAARLTDGEQVTLTPCDTAVAISAGTHLLTTARHDHLNVARVVVSSTPLASPVAAAGAAAAPVADITRGGDDHDVMVSNCASGCWLVFGEGFSPGWSATSGDATIGRHLPISGGFNGWWVQPSSGDSAHLTLHWAGQRQIWRALALSGGCALILLVAAVWPVATTRRRRRVASVSLARRSDRDPLRATCLAAGLAIAAVALTGNPKWAVLTLPIPMLAVAVRRTRVIALAGTALVALGSAAIVGGVLLRNYPAGFGWPGSFERLHRPMLAGAVLVAIAAILSPTEPRRPQSDPPP